MSILFPLVNKLDGEANRNEMQDYSACMKLDDGMHAHSSRRIPHVRMGGKVIIQIVSVDSRMVHEINQSTHGIQI